MYFNIHDCIAIVRVFCDSTYFFFRAAAAVAGSFGVYVCMLNRLESALLIRNFCIKRASTVTYNVNVTSTSNNFQAFYQTQRATHSS